MMNDGASSPRDYRPVAGAEEDDERAGIGSQRTPLLGEMMEAGSVTVALAGEAAENGESAKSGMRSAFMNMANSIM